MNLLANLSTKCLPLGFFCTLLLAGLFTDSAQGNNIKPSQVKIALQESIKQPSEAGDRQREWQQQQRAIEQQRQQRQQLQLQENRQGSEVFDRKIEANKQQHQQWQQNQNELIREVKQQRQQRRDDFRQRQLLNPPTRLQN